MDIKAKKAKLRKQVSELRNSICQEDIAAGDKKITERVLSLTEYRQAKTVFLFVSTAAEINTSPLLRDALDNGKRVVVPRCTGAGIMCACQITGLEDLEEGRYSILEPLENCPALTAEEIDFGIIPCVSCDRSGHRLGHGGGFYDRYLAGAAFPTAALCREILLRDLIPYGPFDVTMDMVVTEENIYRIK